MPIADKVRTLLKQRPYLLEALEEDIANQSALSNKIASELKLTNRIAIKAAVRRFADELRKQKKKREESVRQVLRQSTISIEDGLRVIVSRKAVDLNAKVAVSLDNVFIYLMSKSGAIAKSRLLLTHELCGTFVVTSPPLIEGTPGVVSYLTSILAEQGINVIEFVSCYTKTLIVVNREDISRTYEILSSVTR
ncbi:MAG: ACT domain-containing protein [Candidatus Bathyarchaeia archaeon]|jgi:hypothetical protein